VLHTSKLIRCGQAPGAIENYRENGELFHCVASGYSEAFRVYVLDFWVP